MKMGKMIVSLLTWFIGIALLALIVAYLAGGFRTKVEPGKLPGPEAEALAPKFQKVETVRAEDEALVEKAPGTLSALRETMVSPRIMARINEIAVRAGDNVTPGQTLVRLDARDLAARVGQASQGAAAARARLAEAEKEYQRMKKLVNDGVVAQSQFDAAESAWRSAKAEAQRAESATSEAGTGQAFATIEAPFAGRVVDRYAEPGDTAMPGQAILKVYDPSQMRVDTYVRESLAATLKPGQKLAVQIDALRLNVEGTVQEIVPQSEPGSRSVLVKVALPQRDDLYPGMFGRLLIPAGQARRFYIPEGAVQQVGQLTYAWVLGQDNTPQRRFIKLGEEKKDGWLEVISGVGAGERIGQPK